MCFTPTVTAGMIVVGGAAAVITLRRGDPAAIWGTLAYFTGMEALQAAGYAVVDQCGTGTNASVTALSYLHIAFQPVAINLFAMAIAPAPVSDAMRRRVLWLSLLASALLLLRLAPIPALGTCAPGDVLCGVDWCLRSGEWHIAWEVPLNDLPGTLGIPGDFWPYMLAVFVLPLFYGAWRFVLFHAVVGPALAWALTDDPNEMPAIWCLFSIGIILIALSPAIRHRVMGVRATA